MFTDADGKLCKQVDPDDRRLRVRREKLGRCSFYYRVLVTFRVTSAAQLWLQVLPFHQWEDLWTNVLRPRSHVDFHESLTPYQALKAELAASREHVTELQDRIAALQPHGAQVLELEAQAEAFRERIAALEPVEAQVAALQERNAALQEQNAALEEKLRLAKVAHDEEVQRLNEDMARLGGLDGGVGEGESESKSESGAGNVVGGAAAGAGAQEVAGPSETEPTQTVAAANGRDGGRADQDTAGTQDVVKSSPKADA